MILQKYLTYKTLADQSSIEDLLSITLHGPPQKQYLNLEKKADFDQEPVLDRMEIQLKKSGIETNFTKISI